MKDCTNLKIANRNCKSLQTNVVRKSLITSHLLLMLVNLAEATCGKLCPPDFASVAVPVTPLLVSLLVSAFDLTSLYLYLFTRVIKFHCKINGYCSLRIKLLVGDFPNNNAVLGAPSASNVEAEGVELGSEVDIEVGGRF